MTAKGTVTISEPIDSGTVGGEPTVANVGAGFGSCTGSPTNASVSDIAPGATVTVRDAGDKIVGLGELGTAPSKIRYADGQTKLESSLPQGTGNPEAWTGTIFCELPFTVKGVTGGSKFYSVEVAHKGKVTIPANRLDRIRLTAD
ncbi:MAG: hypothetical protein ACXV8R_16895 [Acidimicrobiia bacterium]